MKDHNKKFRISGWYVPALDKKIFRLVKESGLNHIFLQGANVGNDCRDVETIEKYLSLCDLYGLDAYVQRGKHTPISVAVQNATVFQQYRAFKGYIMYDEPSACDYDVLNENVREYYRSENAKDFFVNLLPSYARGDCILENYQQYVRKFSERILSCDMTGEKWLSFDFYPLIFGEHKNYTLAERWLFDTQIIASEGKRCGYRTNAFVQTMPFSTGGTGYGSHERIPSYLDLSLQIYTYLAFGFDSISYFCVGTPVVDNEFSENHYAMFNRNGETTEIYDSVKRLNKTVSAFTKTYMCYSWRETYMLGDEQEECFSFLKTRKPFTPSDKIKNVQTDGNVLFGMFTGNGGEAFVAVNFGEPSLQRQKTVCVDVKGKKSVTIWQNGKKRLLTGEHLRIKLKAGEGVFAIIK